jgi:hypothetical protein
MSFEQIGKKSDEVVMSAIGNEALAPGAYILNIAVTDLIARQSIAQERMFWVELTRFGGRLWACDFCAELVSPFILDRGTIPQR